jgi:hypothetical protein
VLRGNPTEFEGLGVLPHGLRNNHITPRLSSVFSVIVRLGGGTHFGNTKPTDN